MEPVHAIDRPGHRSRPDEPPGLLGPERTYRIAAGRLQPVAALGINVSAAGYLHRSRSILEAEVGALCGTRATVDKLDQIAVSDRGDSGIYHNSSLQAHPLACKLLILKTRRDVRVVEGARLESVCRGNSTVGSNPTLSAKFSPLFQLFTRRLDYPRAMRPKLVLVSAANHSGTAKKLLDLLP